jgi:hypothetical protein
MDNPSDGRLNDFVKEAILAKLKALFGYLGIALCEAVERYLWRIGALSYLDSAYQTQYRQEFVTGFEQHQSLLRDTVTTEAEIKGNVAVFLVADSGGAAAVTRGINGLIPARSTTSRRTRARCRNGTTWCARPASTSSRRRATSGRSCR